MIAITDEMVERAAIAIRDEVANRAINDRGRRKGVEWRALPITLRNAYRGEARAALHAALEA